MVKMNFMWIAIVLVLALLLGGCAGGDGNETSAPTQSQSQPTTTPIGHAFSYQDVTFGVGMDADAVAKALGEPKSRDVTPSCAFADGNDIVYVYDDFKISADDNAGFERIYCVTLTTDLAETDKGICIGSTADEVTAAYGEPTEKTDAGLFYLKDGVELQFFIADGTVERIQYYDASFL